jgi:predicted GH43/DUF377 family glycosyl hydrolase
MAMSRQRRLLVGAYFTHEYSVEGAALFNPSIVLAPDQASVRAGEQRFIMSLRAVGEGHISSIEFRSGVIDASDGMTFDAPGARLVTGVRTSPAWYDKQPFALKLAELRAQNDVTERILERLGDHFTPQELENALSWIDHSGLPQSISHETVRIIRMLASSNYVTAFPADSTLDQRVIFPAGPHETRGMEDARFVRFVEPDGSVRYYATYTAFDGREILPQLIDTTDFLSFRISTLSGSAAQNKGMALFPRRIAGRYVMLSRKDRENLHLAISDDVRHWNESREVYRPSASWELLQIGNCGSPLETEAGWLVITHGVGPMREYSIGAILLDRDDPWKVIGRLRAPLIVARGEEREGYVPNVVYSCGALINGATLVLPFGFSDSGVRVALVALPDLLRAMHRGDGEQG